ncbi:DNA mismatch repair protein MutS [Saprolegnia diclina VS20]|uniref:DNA mismatch repair protein MutS n=1 Tax=Saprolegnia diclina (strain VS20) TaxID=1156394 RepID=T0RDQ8_SAPDV|nr:DNA mismatch repair protein MutS [Saprolegnia diclina VS20]EQC30403.1 DNA mismatch repair protein MutS [Saprolegnia diclina VS20]|eukprot:XP_008616256.1 DNA mismatch repair protein MutS [Saprolegnia diclina VS20]
MLRVGLQRTAIGRLGRRALASSTVTPMLRQYLERKKEYPDCLLLYQVGDFYELFADDARRASHLLNLALTRKAKSKQAHDMDIMCGFPIASLNTYVEKLVRHHGEKVAICNQTESATAAKQRKGVGVHALVQRHVVRVVTPGSLTDDSMLLAGQNNYLAAMTQNAEALELAWTDVSTGEFHRLATTLDELESELCRLSPTEMLLPINAATSATDSFWQLVEAKLPAHCLKTYRPAALSASASAMITEYLRYTHLQTHAPEDASALQPRMLIDASAWRSLEITKSMHGTKQHSLLQAIDKTKTAGGARLLAAHLSAPLLRVDDITRRQDAVSWLLQDTHGLSKLRHVLQECGDIERSLRRLAMGNGTPKDLKRISDTVLESQALAHYLQDGPRHWPCELISRLRGAFDVPEVVAMATDVQAALVDDLTQLNQKHDFIRPGYSKELDRWRSLCHDSVTDQIRDLQREYQTQTGIAKLRVARKKQHVGWCVEVPQDTSPPLTPPHFQLIQTTTKTLRYRSPALDKLNSDVFHALDQSVEVEEALFKELQGRVLAVSAAIETLGDALNQLDVAASHAQNTLDHQLVRPTLSATSADMHIVEGRHWVVASAHEANLRAFVPNSLHFAFDDSCWIVTGPNMGGKSTFLRQTAHLVLLAQMGSFVPAVSAHIGIVDRLFSRVGASDDLASDRSTFMVEMQETATILKQATNRSLILMDEVGRGTSVQDGVAIAQAVVEELLRRQSRTLFATHFTELSSIFASAHAVSFHHMQVARHKKAGLIFSHRVVPGVAKESYGVEVAALAGCPANVVERAKALVQRQKDTLASASVAPVRPAV